MEPKYMTWEEMVEQYPDRWVVIDKAEPRYEDNDCTNIKGGVVIEALTDDEYDDVCCKHIREGKHYIYRRTTETEWDKHFIGVTL